VSKLKPIDDAVRQFAIAAVEATWDSGCPVAGQTPEQHAAIADTCLRRYRSLSRRGVQPHDRAGQARDLVDGLIQAHGTTRRMTGALLRDYEYLVEQVLTAIAAGKE